MHWGQKALNSFLESFIASDFAWKKNADFNSTDMLRYVDPENSFQCGHASANNGCGQYVFSNFIYSLLNQNLSHKAWVRSVQSLDMFSESLLPLKQASKADSKFRDFWPCLPYQRYRRYSLGCLWCLVFPHFSLW